MWTASIGIDGRLAGIAWITQRPGAAVNVYAKDFAHTRQVAEYETEQLFSLERT